MTEIKQELRSSGGKLDVTRPLVLVFVRTQVLNPMVSAVFASTVKVACTAILNRFVCSFVRLFVTFIEIFTGINCSPSVWLNKMMVK